MNYYKGSTLIGGFALLAVLATAGIVALSGGGLVELAGAFAVGLAASVVIIGSYAVSVKKGLPHSHSVAIAGIALGVVYAVALLHRLLTEFGA